MGSTNIMKPRISVVYEYVLYSLTQNLFISGKWISPTVIGDCPPPSNTFSLTSLTDNTFVMFGGKTHDGKTNETYIGHCTKSSIVSIKFTNPLFVGVDNL